MLEGKGVLWMEFGANKAPVEIIREVAFGGTYFRDIYSDVNGTCTDSQGKTLITWKILIKSFFAQIITMLVLINMVLNVEHHWDFGKIRVGLIK